MSAAKRSCSSATLSRRLPTSGVANKACLELAFPTRYHHDVLRALDYFRAAERAPASRMHESLDIVDVGEPRRWSTLRGLRVLRWAGHFADDHARIVDLQRPQNCVAFVLDSSRARTVFTHTVRSF